MSDIILYDITYEINGKFYTTKSDYDHSWLCDISMEDLVLIEGEEEWSLESKIDALLVVRE